ncbi:Oidioi.mRNA.OKI2018_I69.chr1.g3407.t1.cds [Oikopleura dioica]|uniref:Oidioi.mRNA.OKI2018_I69.chr1.g3407.t1.cds n=1 Tax=Oikopleura dioica TaxID=34765 RepID=A0ABN7SYB7_OIKDI|nr:Oidioi.mRNA.OKI2018_I69.chr1.g3407.t1.cds [Oikopleura dioica]
MNDETKVLLLKLLLLFVAIGSVVLFCFFAEKCTKKISDRDPESAEPDIAIENNAYDSHIPLEIIQPKEDQPPSYEEVINGQSIEL